MWQKGVILNSCYLYILTIRIVSMKSSRIYSFALVLITVILSACNSQKEYITESDYSYKAKFKKYKTFQFMTIKETDSTQIKGILEKSIGAKLYSQGYRYSDRKPDLFVGYRIFSTDFNMTGYDQLDIENYVLENWPERLLTDDDTYVSPPPPGHPDTDYYTSRYKMKEGTLLITFYDRRKDQTVWSGYASGVFARDADLKRNLRIATNKIFKEFRLIADGYVIN